jgi:hypothetical protein
MDGPPLKRIVLEVSGMTAGHYQGPNDPSTLCGVAITRINKSRGPAGVCMVCRAEASKMRSIKIKARWTNHLDSP